MERTEEIKRNYPMSSPVMLEVSGIVTDFYEEDQPDFTAADPSYDQAHLDSVKAKLQEAYDQPTDDYIRDVLSQKTAIVLESLRECQNAVQFDKHFVKKLVEKNPLALEQFGYDEYSEIRDKQPQMVVLMENYYDRCVENQVELLASGYTQEKIEKKKELAEDLKAKNKDQEKYKKNRKKITYNRILVYNALWKMIMDIANFGKLIYTGNYGQYQRYVINESSDTEPQTYSGVVAADQTVSIISDVAPATVLDLKNTGSTVLQFCLEDTHNPCAAGAELQPGDEQEVVASNLGDGIILKCTNKSTTNDGAYEVVVV